jgi:hypothetical protein
MKATLVCTSASLTIRVVHMSEKTVCGRPGSGTVDRELAQQDCSRPYSALSLEA